MATLLSEGTTAPDFSLHCTPDQKLQLSELRGRRVVLCFYPADWSPVCSDQLAIYNELREDFEKLHAVVLGISVDGTWCHAAFARERKLHFPLLSDFEPKGEVAKRYGVYRAGEGIAERALFVVDENGKVAWRYVSPVAVNPGADGILDALERIEGGGR
jgi:peroxiredoxin